MSPFFTFDNNLVDMGIMAIMSGAEYKVYSCLKRRRNEKTGECYPSYTRIQKDTGLSRTVVANAISSLAGVKLISIIKNKNRKSNIYRIRTGSDWYDYLTSTESVLVRKSYSTSRETVLVLVRKSYSKNTNITRQRNKTNAGVPPVIKMNSESNNDIGKKNDCRHQQASSSKIPEDLRGLELYEKNIELCENWNGLKKVWETCYPYLDIMVEVRKAHSTQYTNGRRRDPKTYIQTWLNGARGKVNNSNWKGNGKSYKTAQEKNKQEIDCFNNLLEGDSLND